MIPHFTVICAVAQAYLLSSCSSVPLVSKNSETIRPCSEGIEAWSELGEPITSEGDLLALGVLHGIFRNSFYKAIEFDCLPPIVDDIENPGWDVVPDGPAGFGWNLLPTQAPRDDLDLSKAFSMQIQFYPGRIKENERQNQLRSWHIKKNRPVKFGQSEAHWLYSNILETTIMNNMELNVQVDNEYQVGDNHFHGDQPDLPNGRSFLDVFDPTYCSCHLEHTTTTTTSTSTSTTSSTTTSATTRTTSTTTSTTSSETDDTAETGHTDETSHTAETGHTDETSAETGHTNETDPTSQAETSTSTIGDGTSVPPTTRQTRPWQSSGATTTTTAGPTTRTTRPWQSTKGRQSAVNRDAAGQQGSMTTRIVGASAAGLLCAGAAVILYR